MIFHNFEELIQANRRTKTTKAVAVAAAEDRHTLEAACRAKKNNIAEPILVGDKDQIIAGLAAINEQISDYQIFHTKTAADAAAKAVSLVNEGKADFLMKGKIQTADLLHAVLDKDQGLSTGRVMSIIAFFQLPGYHKLLAITDGGMMMYPNLDEKIQIIQNAVGVYHAFGILNPKLAVLTAIENVNPKMPETVDAAALKHMNIVGEITGCIIEGPISYDLAMSREAAMLKCYESPVSGDPDILIVPNISTGNILSKALVVSAGAIMAGFVIGAKVPVALTSRGSSAEEKYLSLVLSASAV